MVAGAIEGMVGKVMMEDEQKVGRDTTKLVKAVGDFVDGVQTIFH